MTGSTRIVVVGAGIFGVTASIELRARGASVLLLDPGPLPHPEASSTDISKAVRMDYGADAFYTELAQTSIERWHEWNVRWDEQLYHEVGFLLMTRRELQSGGFEGDGYRLMLDRGQPVERIDSDRLRERFPAWNAEAYVDGYFNPRGGWAASGRVVARLIDEARRLGVQVREGARFVGLVERGSRLRGVAIEQGQELPADFVVVAAGAWTPALLPELEGLMWATGQPVLHFQPADGEPYRPQRFPVWGADISESGWYGFPLNAGGIVKVAHHGRGRRMSAGASRTVEPAVEQACRRMLGTTFPGLARAPLVDARICLYCDTWDGDFWIDHHPRLAGLVVAAGGSGHGFKFAPVIGEIVADVLERKPSPYAARFAWRRRGEQRTEQARSRSGTGPAG